MPNLFCVHRLQDKVAHYLQTASDHPEIIRTFHVAVFDSRLFNINNNNHLITAK